MNASTPKNIHHPEKNHCAMFNALSTTLELWPFSTKHLY